MNYSEKERDVLNQTFDKVLTVIIIVAIFCLAVFIYWASNEIIKL
jgi:cell division protein FtsL